MVIPSLIRRRRLVELEDTRALEDLYMRFVTARLRKRKKLYVESVDFERFQKAIKAALPPIDLTSHGFKE